MRVGAVGAGGGCGVCAVGVVGADVMTELNKWAVSMFLIAALCAACYMLGRSHSEVKIIKEQGKEVIKQVEVIKYVEKEKAKIWVKPNAGRADLLNLMRGGEL